MAQITTSEIEDLIKKTIQTKGLNADISEEKINEIKNKIIEKANADLNAYANSNNEIEGEEVVDIQPTNYQDSSSITQTTTVDNDEVEQYKKEGELDQKSNELNQKEIDLANRESELQRKEDQLAYEPKLPETLENVGAEEFFVFNTSELSHGAEGMSYNKFRKKGEPDTKSSMSDIWSKDGKTKADVYVVEFKKLGNLEFNPFNGTSTFTEDRFENPEELSKVPQDGLTPEAAVDSQNATEDMQDTIDPVMDKTLPPAEDMGLVNAVDMEKIVKDRVDAIIKDYFLQKYPKM